MSWTHTLSLWNDCIRIQTVSCSLMCFLTFDLWLNSSLISNGCLCQMRKGFPGGRFKKTLCLSFVLWLLKSNQFIFQSLSKSWDEFSSLLSTSSFVFYLFFHILYSYGFIPMYIFGHIYFNFPFSHQPYLCSINKSLLWSYLQYHRKLVCLWRTQRAHSSPVLCVCVTNKSRRHVTVCGHITDSTKALCCAPADEPAVCFRVPLWGSTAATVCEHKVWGDAGGETVRLPLPHISRNRSVSADEVMTEGLRRHQAKVRQSEWCGLWKENKKKINSARQDVKKVKFKT